MLHRAAPKQPSTVPEFAPASGSYCSNNINFQRSNVTTSTLHIIIARMPSFKMHETAQHYESSQYAPDQWLHGCSPAAGPAATHHASSVFAGSSADSSSGIDTAEILTAMLYASSSS